jgi:hypothetical protein
LIVFPMLVNEVHANEVDWLAVVGFGHDCLTLKRNKTTQRMTRSIARSRIAQDRPLPGGWIGYVRRHTALYKVVCLESDSFTEAGRWTA